ncbi:MAG TPA: ABC transporter permease [Propionibacteriaceae bacterium]|jgi:peptide/nickel transport system permease protein|nr:ABC transporter permease [Propionibacteriaceae bacterium]HBY24811.1 ABC transporter permease [Propionibacteriaceae bacterium]
MALHVLKTLVRSLAVLFLVTIATFWLMYGNAVGIARSTLGLQASAADVQRKVTELGLDRPLLVQFGDWLQGAVTGNLGKSYFTGEPVTDALASRVPVTLTLVFITLFLTAVLSVALGVMAAVRGGWVDRIVQFVTVLGTAVPAFIVAIALVFTFAIHWSVFPATGFVSPGESVTSWLASLALPVLALLISSVAGAAAQFRTAVLDTLDRDYVRTLRARGVNERAVIFRHVLRNSAGPGLTVLSLGTLALLGGAVFIEQIFALPGMGQLATTSALQGDIPMVMGAVLVTIIIVLVVNFVGDLALTFLNPKARTR